MKDEVMAALLWLGVIACVVGVVVGLAALIKGKMAGASWSLLVASAGGFFVAVGAYYFEVVEP